LPVATQKRKMAVSSKIALFWNLAKLKAADLSLSVGSESIRPVSVDRDLSVLLDAQLSMKQHINKVTATCYYHLRRLRQIRRRAGQELTTQLVLAFVSSRLDYCNSVLSALPQSIEPLQRVQNAAAQLIFNLSRKEHVTPCLIQLHWLPVQFRITYKLCVMMHNIHVGKAPCYLSDALQLTSTPCPEKRCHLIFCRNFAES